LLIFVVVQVPVYADPIELNKTSSHTVSELIDFIFVDTNEIIEKTATSPFLDFEFTNFTGGPIVIEPWADFIPIGDSVTVSKDGVYTLDFSKIPKNTEQVGILLSPQLASTTLFNLIIKEGIAVIENPTPSPTETTSMGDPFEDVLVEDPASEGESNLDRLFAQANGLLVFNYETEVFNDDGIDVIGDNGIQVSIPCEGEMPCKLIEGDAESLELFSEEVRKELFKRALDAIDREIELITNSGKKKRSKATYTKEIVNDSDKTMVNATVFYLIVLPGSPLSRDATISVTSTYTTSESKFELSENGGFNLESYCITPTILDIHPNDISGSSDDTAVTVTFTGDFTCAQSDWMLKGSDGTAIKTTLFNTSSKRPASLLKFHDKISVGTNESPNILELNNKKILFSDTPITILQPVPPNTTLLQTFDIIFKKSKKCPNPVDCSNSCVNEGACCEADSKGNISKTCSQSLDALIQFCKCQ